MVAFGFGLFLLLTTAACAVSADNYAYEIREFTVPLDHFNVVNNMSFQIRYLYNESYAKTRPQHAPIFFYTGNEGDIELFAQNTGFVWELAAQLGARVVFAEHRYYGKSLPFGAKTFNGSASQLGYFTVEQTLEDFALLISQLQMQGDAKHEVPVVLFGGSYGGMLAAWFRMKYPHLATGALASSAPILQFEGLTPCEIFNTIVTSVYTHEYNAHCSENIKRSWSMLHSLAGSAQGQQQISETLKLCQPIKTANDLKSLIDYLTEVYANIAMVNYPYESSFLAPLPAYPVRQVCLELAVPLKNDSLLLSALSRALAVYTNHTGTTKCVDYKGQSSSAADESGWAVQSCIQMVMPMCSDPNNSSMFPEMKWNVDEISAQCYAKYGFRPRVNDIRLRYGGRHLRDASNIIFTNGLLDPWSGGGVLSNYGNKLITPIIIPEGAHHLDLRAHNAQDPPTVLEARAQIKRLIERWIRDH